MTRTESGPGTAARPLPRLVGWLRRTEPGRLGERTFRGIIEIEIFDRAMTLAAQAFISVLPVLIVLASLLPEQAAAMGDAIVDHLGLPESVQPVVDQALDNRGPTSGTIGVIGGLIVLVSATSFSRALVRMYCRVWDAPKPGVGSAWRWIAAVLSIALSVVIVRAAVLAASGSTYESATVVLLTFLINAALWGFVPWLLLAAQVKPRMLVPGALVSGVGFVAAVYASGIYMPVALTSSATRFGPIGVAFTYLTWLFVLSFIVVVATVVGWAVATDRGWLGRHVRGRADAEPSTGSL